VNRAEKVSSVVLIAFGLFVAFYSRQYLKLGKMITPGAGFLPYWIGIILVVLGALWFLETFLARTGSEREATPGMRRRKGMRCAAASSRSFCRVSC
jgi:hypothetical protein